MLGTHVTVVSGLPRSGTSMLMRMIEAGGVAVLSDGVRRADEDNPRGYYEWEAAKLLPDQAEWLAQARGRVVKVISALLDRLPSNEQYRVVFLERDIVEVLASQRRMLERRGQPTDRVSDEMMAAGFRKHVLTVLGRVRERPEMQLLVLAHADVMASPAAAAQRLDDFLGGGFDREAMANAVDSALWRQRGSALVGRR